MSSIPSVEMPSDETDCPQCGSKKSVGNHDAEWGRFCCRCGFCKTVDEDCEAERTKKSDLLTKLEAEVLDCQKCLRQEILDITKYWRGREDGAKIAISLVKDFT